MDGLQIVAKDESRRSSHNVYEPQKRDKHRNTSNQSQMI